MSLLGYSFASGITLIILAAVYMLLLRNSTHFIFNRACVLSILAASLVIPFVTLPTLTTVAPVTIDVDSLTFSAAISESPASNDSVGFLRIAGWIYLAGVSIMALRYITNLFFIIYLRSVSHKRTIAGQTVRVHRRANIPPMTWSGEIFVEESLLSGDCTELEMILAHEDAHRSQYHWLDLLLSNVVLAINWYNPAAWIMQHELIAAHEYEADRIASDKSGDKMKYQLLLIKKTAGNRYHAIADSLNHSSLKKRIKMMMKSQTKGNARLRSLALLPAVAVALLLSNSSCVKNAQDKIDESSQTDTTEISTVRMASPIRILDKDGKDVDFSQGNAPLVIIDGVEGSYDSIDPSNIESIAVLPDSVAKEQYGDRAPNGVIVVTTKGPVKTTSETQPEIASKAPEFVGGIEKLYKMLADNIRYPEDAMKAGIQGKVIVELTVGTNGEISNAKVLKGINKSLDKAALAAIERVKEAGGKFTPGIDSNGNPISTTFVLPVVFKLQ